VAEDNGKEEEKFDFTAEGEGYISLDGARVLALRATNETPGDYGSQYQSTTMVFAVVESTETDDNYVILLSVRPQGKFSGTPGQEQFFIGKEGSIAFRQVLSLPAQTSASPADTARKGGGFPLLPVAIGVVVVGVIAAVGAVLLISSSGGDNVPMAAVAPTETPAPVVIPADRPESTVNIDATVEARIQNRLEERPTSVPVPTATDTAGLDKPSGSISLKAELSATATGKAGDTITLTGKNFTAGNNVLDETAILFGSTPLTSGQLVTTVSSKAHTDRDADSSTDVHALAHVYPVANTDTHANADAYAIPNTDTHSGCYADCCTDTDA
jgi:hypothetical protein